MTTGRDWRPPVRRRQAAAAGRVVLFSMAEPARPGAPQPARRLTCDSRTWPQSRRIRVRREYLRITRGNAATGCAGELLRRLDDGDPPLTVDVGGSLARDGRGWPGHGSSQRFGSDRCGVRRNQRDLYRQGAVTELDWRVVVATSSRDSRPPRRTSEDRPIADTAKPAIPAWRSRPCETEMARMTFIHSRLRPCLNGEEEFRARRRCRDLDS
jgi:hypothetical protein